jgi:hypothetical protein
MPEQLASGAWKAATAGDRNRHRRLPHTVCKALHRGNRTGRTVAVAKDNEALEYSLVGAIRRRHGAGGMRGHWRSPREPHPARSRDATGGPMRWD